MPHCFVTTTQELHLLILLFTCHSLLDILADKKDRKWVTGHVLINGEKQPQNFKCASGYVVQVCM